jgi:hypothetical protein
MGFCAPGSIRLREFVEDCLRRSGNQIRPSTKTEYTQAMNNLIQVIGNVDYRAVDWGKTERTSLVHILVHTIV